MPTLAQSARRTPTTRRAPAKKAEKTTLITNVVQEVYLRLDCGDWVRLRKVGDKMQLERVQVRRNYNHSSTQQEAAMRNPKPGDFVSEDDEMGTVDFNEFLKAIKTLEG